MPLSTLSSTVGDGRRAGVAGKVTGGSVGILIKRVQVALHGTYLELKEGPELAFDPNLSVHGPVCWVLRRSR